MKDLPPHYCSTIRTALRFALVMVVVSLLAGILFQESSKKLGYDILPAGPHLEAVLNLGLVHGHSFVIGVLIPIAMAGALVLARCACGGRELRSKTLKWLTRGYLPFATFSLALLLYKGYHVLLAARGGEKNFEVIYAGLFDGVTALRHALYGISHTGMAVSLAVFSIALFRSLGAAKDAE